MTSPYSSSLLQQSTDTDTATPATPPRPNMAAPARSVTHVVPAPMQAPVQYAPAPAQTVYVAPRGSRVSALMLGLVVILIGAVALVGAYYATKNASPSAQEIALAQSIAVRDGFTAGRTRGLDAGQNAGFARTLETAKLNAAVAKQRAWDKGYTAGLKAGERSYRRTTYSGYRGGNGIRYSFPYGGGTWGALGQAQSLADATGAPVDVEIY